MTIPLAHRSATARPHRSHPRWRLLSVEAAAGRRLAGTHRGDRDISIEPAWDSSINASASTVLGPPVPCAGSRPRHTTSFVRAIVDSGFVMQGAPIQVLAGIRWPRTVRGRGGRSGERVRERAVGQRRNGRNGSYRPGNLLTCLWIRTAVRARCVSHDTLPRPNLPPVVAGTGLPRPAIDQCAAWRQTGSCRSLARLPPATGTLASGFPRSRRGRC